MAATLYGPRGEPLIVSTDREGLEKIANPGRNEQLAKALQKVDWDELEGAVTKRVRSQANTLTQVWDPRRGKPKPTSVTFDTLRMMSNRNEWCAAIIKTRKNQIGKTGWAIKPRDEDDNSPATVRLCELVEKLIRRPSMRGSRPHSRSWRQFIGEVLQDLLALDAGAIEKERNGRKWVVAMYPVDGATICPNVDERGGYHDDAYVQIVEGQVTARFGMEDLAYIMDNPQTDVRYAGYGFSPLEHLIVSITAELYASKYNASYFEKGAIPEGLINLGEDVTPEDVDAFRLYWMNEIMGKPWAIPIVGGKGVEWIPWRQSNKDMEYMAYQQWLLKKMCAVYQIAPQEIGELEDVNRSTANEQQDSNQTKSIEPILTLVEDYFEVEVIGEHGLGVGDLVKFEFDKEDDDEAQVDQAFTSRVQAGAATRNEWREAVGMEPSEEEGADMLLVAGQLTPLPTHQDAELLSASGQADREDKQAEQQSQMGGVGEGTMPWKPANPGDPKFQDAKAAHDTTSGLGPRQEAPQPPVGKTAADPHPPGTHIDVWHHSTWESTPPHHVKGAPIHLGTEDAAKQRVFMRSGLPENHARNPTIHSYSLKPGTRIAHLSRPVRERTAVTRPDFEPKLKAKGFHGYAYRNDREDAGSTSVKLFDRSQLVHRASDEYRVNKSTPNDRDPALTDVHDDLEQLFDEAQDRLHNTLERLLGIPREQAAELATSSS